MIAVIFKSMYLVQLVYYYDTYIVRILFIYIQMRGRPGFVPTA